MTAFARVYLALGSNLGDRERHLRLARESLAPDVRVIRASTIYETPPWGVTEQPSFLNQVLLAESDLPPRALLHFLKERERALGRVPTFRYGPRVIDIDILFYDDILLESPDLVIPHPRIPERAFVLVPMAELAPEFRHPALGKTMQELLDAVDSRGIRPFHI
jgi:2-amino-4-hydroxy-6-hydroxymethyldihydropteridine diphosphokinase